MSGVISPLRQKGHLFDSSKARIKHRDEWSQGSNIRGLGSAPLSLLQNAPQSLEAEQAVLGAMLMEMSAIEKAPTILEETDFYHLSHRVIWSAILSLFERRLPIDVTTVNEELREREHLNGIGGSDYLMALIENCPSAAHIEAYATAVLKRSCERELIEVGQMMVSCASTMNLEVGINLGKTRIRGIEERGSPGVLISKGVNLGELLSRDTPEPEWVVPGFLPPGLSIFGGMMKTGKSWLMLSLALSVAGGSRWLGKYEVPQGDVLCLCLEDTLGRLKQRTTKLIEGIPPDLVNGMLERIEFHTEWPKADQGGLDQIDFWLSNRERAKLVLVDVLQKFKPAGKGGNPYEEDYAAMGALKTIADKHGVAIMMVHHMSKREVDDPFLALSGTVALTGACDAIFALVRPRGKQDAVLHMDGRDIGGEQKAITWDPQSCTWTVLGDAQEFQEIDARTEVLNLLRENVSAMSPYEIAQELDRKPPSVRKLIRAMLRDGEVLSHARGLYSAAQMGVVPSQFA